MKFFIFSLPRSRSAWLSLFLSSADSFCFHEPLGDEVSLVDRMAARPEPVVGAIDTGAYRSYEAVLEMLPDAHYFMLYRDPVEIQRSSDKFGVTFDARKEYERLCDIPVAHTIYANGLNDVDYLESLWVAIVGTPFDRERAPLMTEMHIERDVYRYFSNRPHLRNPLSASWN